MNNKISKGPVYSKPCHAGAAYLYYGNYVIDKNGCTKRQMMCFKCGRPVKEKRYRWIHMLDKNNDKLTITCN
jgi:hypothetical protein